jgi:transposase
MDYYINDYAWEKIYMFLTTVKGIHCRNSESLRTFIEGVYYVLRTGCQWRMLPKCYGHWRAVHKRFKHWAERGIWEELMESVSDVDMQDAMIDSTIVRAHACAAGYEKDGNAAQALGKSKGGFTTKIHVLVDALGLPIKFILTGGQVHDSAQSKDLLRDVSNANVLADNAYYSKDLHSFLFERGCNVVIPPKSNAKEPHEYDKEIYKERHLIECFFSKLKHFRRVFSRFDKTTISFSGFLNIAGSLIWLR